MGGTEKSGILRYDLVPSLLLRTGSGFLVARDPDLDCAQLVHAPEWGCLEGVPAAREAILGSSPQVGKRLLAICRQGFAL